MSVIEKVRRLRALATSDNVHEAAAAAAAAERLIQEYNLSETDLRPATDELPCDEWLASGARRIPTWIRGLRAGLTRAYQCRGINDGRRYRVFGRREDIDTFTFQMAFYTTEITRLAARSGKGKGRTWSNSFRIGAAEAICNAIKTANSQVRAAATSTALAVVDKRMQASQQALAKAYPHTKKTTVGSQNLDRGGYEAGQRAGAGISQRSQIGAGGMRLLGS